MAKRSPSLDAIDREIGRNIRMQRRIRDITQAQLAVAIGVSAHQLQKYETGANRIAASRLVQVAAVLGAEVKRLVPNVIAPNMGPDRTEKREPTA